ncbi:hypothetical protein J2795_001674 [Chryseobacterium bernardetii]|uniref:Uncharacterized protein n=2 Tax=Chryseobacterium TaxID=59732 RepID=A0A543EIF4_9FLAO|nr:MULTISPECIES: hypothetical protein [Chryseobacterium]MDR6369783.1 hypothetical protein [Chryseobacterium vietnamense]MDR6440974.1 hypothetical protein [Chryseobacterium bernardetii]TQM21346.1 hypothetical protein FB551_1032 [Chryseobacterium aquifrigidense]
MDRETINYIIRYFGKLMTRDEALALNHHMYTLKSSESEHIRNVMIKRGWINSDPEVIKLLEHGYEVFEQNVVTRIIAETPEKVFFNNCPKCNKLARTPYAKQCRHCGYSWHDVTAKFKISSAFQLTNRSFYLLGEIIEGEINPGQLMDLTILGLHKKIKIRSIELADGMDNEKPWNRIGLGTNDLTEDEKQHLKQKSFFNPIINIFQS